MSGSNSDSDIDDLQDIEMILKVVGYGQSLPEQEAESSRTRNYIYRDLEVAEERLTNIRTTILGVDFV